MDENKEIDLGKRGFKWEEKRRKEEEKEWKK